MHYRLLVTITLANTAISGDARHTVFNTLMADDSFCGDGGRFGAPRCDWFVIGGRWSGLLSETIIGPAYEAAIVARFPDMKGWYPASLIERYRPELDRIWLEHGGLGPSPYTRSAYEQLGYPDDAMAITPLLYDALLAEYEGEDSCDGYVDLNFEALKRDFIGRKWLVVVDYHS